MALSRIEPDVLHGAQVSGGRTAPTAKKFLMTNDGRSERPRGHRRDPHQPADVIETAYQTDEHDATVLKMRNESTGFGSRTAGRQLRTKCLNLLNAEPSKPLVLDWTAVPLVSSSFADELVGKLFASLGPLAFAARVRNVGMEAVVRALVDKAIMQRVAQVANGATDRADAD